MWRFGQSVLLVGLVCLVWPARQDRPVSAESDALMVAKDASTVSVVEGKRSLLLYRFGDAPFKPYVKELFTPKGVQILRDSPTDHVHHRGLMFALWIEGVDFWSEETKSGKQIHDGLQIEASSTVVDVERAAFTQQLHWTAPGLQQPLVTERRTIEVYVGAELGATLLSWHADLKPGPDLPSVKLTGSHYDGLGMRFVRSMDGGGSFLYATGEPGPVVRGTERVTATKWCAYTAMADGQTVTVALFDHPHNRRQPAGMFSMHGHFAYLSATPNVWKQPLVLKAGQSLALRYGIALWDGAVDEDTIENLYQRWLRLDAPRKDK